jgi:LCP family protein required for cell wall assembly
MKHIPQTVMHLLGGRQQLENGTYELSPYRPAYHPALVVRKKKGIARWAQISGAGMVLIFAVAGYTGWRSLSEVNQIYAMQKAVTQPAVVPTQTALKADAVGKTNILLLGVAGGGNRGADLTDMMAILQIDKATNKTSYIMLPRPLLVRAPSPYYGEWQQLNTVYAAGKYTHLGKADANSSDPLAKQAGFTAIDATIKEVTGLDMHYNILVDYAAFSRAIDSVGGITISSPKRINDWPLMRQYGKKWVVAERGEQTMNGKQALLYARTFAGAGERGRESQRVERQLQIVKAYVSKLSSAGLLKNPVAIGDVVSSLGASFYSDMKPGESIVAAKTLLGTTMRYSGFVLYDSTDALGPFKKVETTRNDQIEPKAGRGNYAEVQQALATRLNGGVPADEEFAILE